MKTWDELKLEGSAHYRTQDVQPIDLYRALGIFNPWAIGEICQHALRNINKKPDFEQDMGKIIHYASLMLADHRQITGKRLSKVPKGRDHERDAVDGRGTQDFGGTRGEGIHGSPNFKSA